MDASGIREGGLRGDGLLLERNAPSEAKAEKNFMRKVWDVIVKIFNFLCFWKCNPLRFTNEEKDTHEKEVMHGRGLQNRVRIAENLPIKNVQNDVAPLLPNKSGSNPENQELLIDVLAPIQPSLANRQITVLQLQEDQIIPPRFKEEYLNKVVDQGVRIAGDVSDIIFEEEVAPILLSFQKGAEGIPELLKMVAGIVLKLGLAANKHYGSLIEKYTISEVINGEFRFLLNWLTTNDFAPKEGYKIRIYKEDLYDQVVAAANLKARPEMKKYIEPTAKWVIQTDRSKPLKEFLADKGLNDEDTSKETCNLVVQILIGGKIDQYSEYINEVLQNNLPTIIHKYMKEDIVKMAAQVELEQLMEIVRAIKWPVLIDSTVEVIYDQTNAYLAGARGVQAYRKTQEDDKALQEQILLHKKRLSAVPATPEEQSVQNHAKSALIKIERDQKHASSDKFFEGYSTHIKGQNFVAHPAVKKVIDAYLKGDDMLLARAKSEHDYFSEKAEQILDILLPGDKANIEFWMNKLKLPNEFKEIVEHTKKIAQEVISPSLLALADQVPSAWRQRILDEAGNIGVLEAKKILKEILVKKLIEKLNLYTDPDEIDELMGEMVVPDVLIPQMIQTVAKHDLLLKIKEFAPLFYNLFGQNPNGAMDIIRLKLFQETQTLIPDVNFASIGMTQVKFTESVESFIKEIQERLGRIRDVSPDEFCVEKVEKLLVKYFEDDDLLEDERPVYGKLVTNLVSEMSNAGSWAKWGVKKVEKALSNVLVTSMRDMRTSPEFTLKLVLEKLPILFSKAKLDEFIYGPEGEERARIRTELSQKQKEFNSLPSNDSVSAKELKSKIEELQDKLEKLKADQKSVSRAALRTELSKLEKSLRVSESLSIKTDEDLEKIAELKNQISNHRLTKSRDRLKRNMHVLSSVVYNLAMTKIDYFGRKVVKENTFSFLGGLGAVVGKKIAGGVIGNSEDINRLITDLYQKLLGDHERNKSLIYVILDLALNQMSIANQEICTSQNIQAEVKAVQALSSVSVIVNEERYSPLLLQSTFAQS